MNTTDAIKQARELMDTHGLQDWVVRYSPAVKQFGACYYRRKCILLSKALVELNDEAEVLDTILHEIAHALAGAKAGHGAEWRAVCRRIGCRPERCYSSAKVNTPLPRFKGECPKCKRVIKRYRRTKISCGTCSPNVFNPDVLFTWERVTT